MRSFQTPLTESDVRSLRAGQFITLSGTVFTARDAVHKFLAEDGALDCDLHDAVIYHCGPVVVRKGDQWQVTAAGPTTSIREEPYMADLIAKYKFKAIIGKGGMGKQTLEACHQHGCVYLHAIGGAAQTLAESIVSVTNVYGYERFGSPEAVWQLEVEDFPALVTMDAHKESLSDQVSGEARRRMLEML